MTITLHKAGKRYNRDWIFRNVDQTFERGKIYALLGPNGSGKSTLLKAIAGYLRLSEGSMKAQNDGKDLDEESIYQYLSVCAPYIDLINDLTVEEHLHFHAQFKPLKPELTLPQTIDLLGFQKHRKKLVRQLSSGMRQRLKLILTIGSDVPVVLLDEPATNLDEEGVQWYQDLLEEHQADRCIVIASNRKDEYEMCDEWLQMEDFQ